MEELSKVFKTWEHIKFVCCENSTRYDPIELDCAVIEEALNELKAIKEAKPSEAMDCLERIKNPLFERFKSEGYSADFIKDYEGFFFETIKQALLKSQEREKENTEYKQLEKQLGCSPEVVIKALRKSEFEGLDVNTVDTDDRKWTGLQRCNLRYDAFNNRFYWCNGYFCIPLSDYKIRWWLKKDRSE